MENNQNNQSNQKKTLILSIIGILVLVIAVVGVSFAMFTFSGTGVKENILRTGTISVDFDTATKQNKIEITNQYPESDTKGADPTDTSNETTFTVEGSWGSSPMTVNYEVGLSDITPGSTLTAQYVKINFQKNVKILLKIILNLKQYHLNVVILKSQEVLHIIKIKHLFIFLI